MKNLFAVARSPEYPPMTATTLKRSVLRWVVAADCPAGRDAVLIPLRSETGACSLLVPGILQLRTPAVSGHPPLSCSARHCLTRISSPSQHWQSGARKSSSRDAFLFPVDTPLVHCESANRYLQHA